jgi:hypothetical protein
MTKSSSSSTSFLLTNDPSLTCADQEFVKNEAEHSLVRSHVLAGTTKTLVDDREENTQTDEQHQEDEQSESHRTENGRCANQFTGVELHQTDFEEHLGCAEKCGTRGDLRDEEKIEQGHEREEHDGEHECKGEQFSCGEAKGVNEQRNASIGTKETNEANRGEERTKTEEESEDVIDIDSQLKIDVNITTALFEERSKSNGFFESPNIDSHRNTRTNDDSHLDQRPKLTKISTLHSLE